MVVCVWMLSCVRTCMCACVRACVHVCMHACAGAHVRVCHYYFARFCIIFKACSWKTHASVMEGIGAELWVAVFLACLTVLGCVCVSCLCSDDQLLTDEWWILSVCSMASLADQHQRRRSASRDTSSHSDSYNNQRNLPADDDGTCTSGQLSHLVFMFVLLTVNNGITCIQ